MKWITLKSILSVLGTTAFIILVFTAVVSLVGFILIDKGVCQ